MHDSGKVADSLGHARSLSRAIDHDHADRQDTVPLVPDQSHRCGGDAGPCCVQESLRNTTVEITIWFFP